MIVYDLDSLIGVNKSEGNSSMGRSTNLSLINHNIYTYIKEKFQNARIETLPKTTDVNNTVVNEEEKAEMLRADERIKCVRCNDYYIEQENKMGVSVHHDGFVYDNHSLTLDQWGQRAVVEQLLKEEADAVKQAKTQPLTPEQKGKLEREKQRWKYICCNQTVQVSGMMGGCKKGKHSPANVTRNEWDYACDNNKDYQEKQLTFLRFNDHLI